MKRPPGKIAPAITVLFGFALLTGSLRAQGNFVYTNDERFGPNTVSGFSVASNGMLTPVPGSPFATGGTSDGHDFLTTNLITASNVGDFLFASNTISNDVSVFNIDTNTGTLSLVAGSPFATGGVGRTTSLSPTPDGRFLMVTSGNLTVFSIAGSGALTPIAGSPFSARSTPGEIKVSPNGKFLAVAEPFSNQVEMFSIASNGSLTSLGAFAGGGGSGQFLTRVDIDCASSLLYGGEDSSSFPGTIVDSYSIASNGTLTPVPGSPFTAALGCVAGFCGGTGGVLLSPDDKTLFVSNTSSYTITVFSVAANGSLSLVPGSPFPSAATPFDMATSQNGSLLYSATFTTISGFNVASNGALNEVAGSPFFVPQSEGQESLTAFPPKSCFPAPTVTTISPTSTIAGGPAFTLTVNGTNFVSGSTVNFNGSALATTFVSATQLAATVPASDIATVGSFNVTVTNPSGGTSNAVSFTVVTPQEATQTIINSVNALFSQGVINEGQDNSLVVQLQHAIGMMDAGKNNGAIGNLDSFITEVNDLLSSGILSASQAASLISAAQSAIAAL